MRGSGRKLAERGKRSTNTGRFLCVDIFELVTIGAVEDLGYFVLFLLEELVIFWFVFLGGS